MFLQFLVSLIKVRRVFHMTLSNSALISGKQCMCPMEKLLTMYFGGGQRAKRKKGELKKKKRNFALLFLDQNFSRACYIRKLRKRFSGGKTGIAAVCLFSL